MNIYGGRLSLYQWDMNQKVKHTGLKIGEELHWSNIKQPEALITTAYDLDGTIVADVPNILLQSSSPITVYRVITDDNGRYTREDFQFTVEQRPKPADYVYTETEVKRYEDLEKRIEVIENSGGGSGGTTDHSALLNRDLPDQHPMSAITGLEKALANAGGGSGKEWRKIRTVTIPEDITTDTSGVSFIEIPQGGYVVQFDTDESGEPFSVDDIFIEYQLQTSKATVQQGIRISNQEWSDTAARWQYFPLYSAYLSQNGGGYATGWLYIQNCGGRGYHISTSLQVGFKTTHACLVLSYEKMCIFPEVEGGFQGFMAGSVLNIYGR